jgi:glycosyltransferase involved in cell wall biosynthesis
MPRVSILLTCFNHMRYLPAALESINAQTFRDFEILAIDDGSSDGTREWLTARPEPMTRIFNATNLGTYGALNAGLAAAKGELIAVMNDDDLWAPTKLERQVDLLDSHPEIGLVHTDGEFIDGEGKQTPGSPLGFEFPRFETGELSLALVYQNKIIASAALARRSCFDDLGGFNEAYFGSGDWEMWIRIAEKWKVGFVEEPLTFYRVHGANASHKLERIWRDDEMLRRWLEPRLDAYTAKFPLQDVRRAKSHNFAALGTVLTLNGHPSEGRRMYSASLRERPMRWQSALRYVATYLPPPVFRKLL